MSVSDLSRRVREAMSDPAAEPLEQGTEIRPGTVYVLFDKDDTVLYVGMTARGLKRIRDHAVEKEWWPKVARAEFHHYSTEYMTRRAEGAYIDLLKPIHNVMRPWAICKVCGDRKAHSYGRCGACASYFARYGKERSEQLIERGRRREQERNVRRDTPTIRNLGRATIGA